MAGDISNTKVWAEADVLLGALTSAIPEDGEAFSLIAPDPWAYAGILDGSAGFTESNANSNTDHTGWGYGVIATSRKDQTITRTFTALEDNAEILGLRYNTEGVTFTGNDYAGDLAGRDLQAKFKIAFEVRTGDEIKRFISKNYAQIDTLGDVSETEDNLAMLPVTVKIYPEIVDDEPVYWTVYRGAAA